MCLNIQRSFRLLLSCLPHPLFYSGSKQWFQTVVPACIDFLHPTISVFYSLEMSKPHLHCDRIKTNLKKDELDQNISNQIRTRLEPDYDHFYEDSLTGDSKKNEIGLNVHTGHLLTAVWIPALFHGCLRHD